MTLLDDITGFEFEAVMVDVFRHQGYDDVQRAELIADEGRDVTMLDDRGVAADDRARAADHREPAAGDGERAAGGAGDPQPTAVVVECKHTDVVSRPVVQKTHSAAHTYEYDGPVRAMIATTGRFTEPAREYAERVDGDPDDVGFALLDGEDLRDLSETIPLDLYNGRIEIVCEDAIAPPTDRETLEGHLEAAAADVHDLDEWTVGATLTAVRFEPVLVAETAVDARFETDAGVIHEVRDRERSVLDGHASEPERCRETVEELVERTRADRISVDDHALDGTYDRTDIERFEHDERRYREWLVDDLADRHETTVTYTGDNAVEYEKSCRPGDGDVEVEALDPVYLPHVAVATSLGEYEYELELYAAGDETLVRDAEFERCVHCEAEREEETTAGDDRRGQRTEQPLTYCANCGAIACPDHVETERLVGEPVCTGCAVTGRFAGATRYFYDETNRETFAEAYAEMPLHRKVRENDGLVAGLVLAAFLLAVVAVGVLDDATPAVIATSTPLALRNDLSARELATLGDSERVIPAYDEAALRSIFERRVSRAFADDAVGETLLDGVVQAALERDGDVGYGLELLDAAADVAMEEDAVPVTRGHLVRARERVAIEAVAERLDGLRRHHVLSLRSLCDLAGAPTADAESRLPKAGR